MTVRILSEAVNTAEKSVASNKVRAALKSKHEEYRALNPTEHWRKASGIAKKIREFEEGVKTDPLSIVHSRSVKTGLFIK